ncbi:restriction endonuclease subunit S [Bacteroides sp. A1-P5]|uniref:restriction endonuclease subunit S n=2 Tax=Bacteroides TaxID=816 RepID=UPI002AAD043B|nr:restriction endonuclease subunit S [Bacteroides sp. A1-P5]MDY7253603.1 restriction endonuclease subunit S [Bacteroides sp. A1-P5]
MRFPEFSGEWKKVKVSKLLDFYSANSLSWEQLDYNNGKIKNLHYGLIHKGVPTMVDVSSVSLPYIKEETMPKSYTLFKEGDVAFADASEDTNDVAKAIEVINCDSQQIVSGLHTIHGRDNSNQTVIGYKGYAFASDSFHKQIRRIAQGTKVFSISVRNFDEVYIGIPSKKEQTKIAKLLIAIDERIATQNKIIEKLQSLIKGLNQHLLCSGNDWITYKLNNLAQIKSGYSGNQISIKTPYKVSRIETISKHCIDIQRIGYVEDIPESYKLNVSDILFSNINSVQYIGNTAYLDKDYGLYHGMNLLRIIPKTDIVVPRFLHLLLCTNKAINHFQTICNKAVSQASINQTDLSKSTFAIPSMSVQQEICSMFEVVERKLRNEQVFLDNLQRQRRYLLQQMFI